MAIDLHMHSTASDGTVLPKELPKLCADVGLTHVVLTDHDTVAGVEAFLEAAEERGLKAVSGVEFSAQWDGELHILAYDVDIKNELLKDTFERLAVQRENRAGEIVDNLRQHGLHLTMEDALAEAKGDVLGRPHIGRALVAKGYANTLSDAFNKYLVEGCPGFAPRYSLTEAQVMALVLAAGGKPVFAHPKLTKTDDFELLLLRLKEMGLMGVEAFYPLHSDAECAYYHSLAKKHGLFVTQGSDFHGAMRNGAQLGMEKRGQNDMEEALDLLFDSASTPT